MALYWDDTLLLGHTEIDEQHRAIFAQFDRLSQACQQGQGEEVLNELFEYLDDYVNQHFSREEAFMAEHDYPKLAEQQEQHARFRQMVQEMRTVDSEDKSAHHLSVMVRRELILWFIQHIKHLDQEMVDYILAQQSPG